MNRIDRKLLSFACYFVGNVGECVPSEWSKRARKQTKNVRNYMGFPPTNCEPGKQPGSPFDSALNAIQLVVMLYMIAVCLQPRFLYQIHQACILYRFALRSFFVQVFLHLSIILVLIKSDKTQYNSLANVHTKRYVFSLHYVSTL